MYNITPSTNSLFGPNFSFSPNEGVLHPEGLQAIQVCSMLYYLCIFGIVLFCFVFRFHFALLYWENLMKCFC